MCSLRKCVICRTFISQLNYFVQFTIQSQFVFKFFPLKRCTCDRHDSNWITLADLCCLIFPQIFHRVAVFFFFFFFRTTSWTTRSLLIVMQMIFAQSRDVDVSRLRGPVHVHGKKIPECPRVSPTLSLRVFGFSPSRHFPLFPQRRAYSLLFVCLSVRCSGKKIEIDQKSQRKFRDFWICSKKIICPILDWSRVEKRDRFCLYSTRVIETRGD